ncbi:MAG TPA: LysM peptidoglycan-binding domain-containing protein [Patescibacteria group bacterium]
MPRKRKKLSKTVLAQKQTRKTSKRISRRIRVLQKRTTSQTKSSKWFKWGESYTSLLLGIVVVIIGILFIASLAKGKHTQEVTSTSTTATPTIEQPTAAPSQEMYQVAAGDSLWSISEKVYKSGFEWVKIAQANQLTNPGSIDIGQKLIIPTEAPTVTPTPTIAQLPTISPAAPTVNPRAITGETYTIQKGDNLWDIAVRAYADGYKWVDIAHANGLTNPNLIFSGNTLIIPR